MKIAKGRLTLSEGDFHKIFNVPNDVSVIDVEIDEYDGGINFLVASPEPVKGFTLHIDTEHGYSMSNYRKQRLVAPAQTIIKVEPLKMPESGISHEGGTIVD